VTVHRCRSICSAPISLRGYSVTEQPTRARLSGPRYTVESTARRWRDLEGYYTRFGDVRPLLATVDDRYVIMNAATSCACAFKAAPPHSGWVRDFRAVATAG
jgi:hypothetical protein